MCLVDVAVENSEGNFYQFLYVDERALRAAVDKALADEVVLSLVSSDNSAALVIPWRSVQRVMHIDVRCEAKQETEWVVTWDRASQVPTKKKSRKSKKVAHE
jgi:hypothetical protein